MNIDELKAGEELNMLIAEKIFGWNKGKNFHHVEGWTWINETNEPAHSSTWDGHWIRYFSDTPEYSSSIKDAWLIVEKMSYLGYYYTIFRACEAPCEVLFNKNEASNLWSLLSASEETVPLAICKASLKAIDQK